VNVRRNLASMLLGALGTSCLFASSWGFKRPTGLFLSCCLRAREASLSIIG
jgi:hypothetical protein